MEQRLAIQCDAERLGHRVEPQLRLRGLQRPRGMVDLAAQDAPAVIDYVQAVALREPAADRVVCARSGRPIACAESRRRPGSIDALARVPNLLTGLSDAHSSLKVRQPVAPPGRRDSGPACG